MIDDLFSKICFELGSTACEHGDLTLTYMLYGRAFSDQDNPAMQATLAATLKKLGQLYMEKELPADAERLYEKAVTIYKHLAVPDHEGLRDALDELADHYRRIGKYAQSAHAFEEAMKIEEEMEIKDKKKRQKRLEQIIWLQLRQGNYENAQSTHQLMSRVQCGPDRTH
jgi:tetratricopeptide (TPR) repeat protein